VKKNKTYLLGSMVAIAIISNAAIASASDEGFYAGGNIGVGKPNIHTPNGEDKSSSVVGGIVLGYKFNKYLGFEGEYTGIGKVTDKVKGTAKGDAVSIAAISFLPLNDELNLYGKLGIAATKTKVSSSLTAMNDDTRTAITYGLGGEYVVSKNIGIRLGWDHYNAAIKDMANSKDNFSANVFSVGAVYNF
jgi:OOP family OmpA-OmpF porin